MSERVRQYQRRLLDRQSSDLGKMEESRRDLDRRRREIMMKYAPQLVRKDPMLLEYLSPLSAMRESPNIVSNEGQTENVSSKNRDSIAEDIFNRKLMYENSNYIQNTGLITNGDSLRGTNNESLYSKYLQVDSTQQNEYSPDHGAYERHGLNSDALLRILQREKIPSELEMFHDVSSMITTSEKSMTLRPRPYDSTSDSNSVPDSLPASEDSNRISLPDNILEETPKPARILEQILAEPDQSSSPGFVLEDPSPNQYYPQSQSPNEINTNILPTPVSLKQEFAPLQESFGHNFSSNLQTSDPSVSENNLASSERPCRLSSSNSSFPTSLSDSDFEQRQLDLEKQLIEIRQQKADISERQKKQKNELSSLQERWKQHNFSSSSNSNDESVQTNEDNFWNLAVDSSSSQEESVEFKDPPPSLGTFQRSSIVRQLSTLQEDLLEDYSIEVEGRFQAFKSVSVNLLHKSIHAVICS